MTTDNGSKAFKEKAGKQKKSETLEVRIPFETKQAFLTACRDDGTTASEVVRAKVQDYLDERERPSQPEERRSIVMKFPEPVRRYGVRIAAGSALAIGMAAMVALPSAAAPDFKAQFSRLDKNGDGILSIEEFTAEKDGEAKETKNITIHTTSSTSTTSDGVSKPLITISPEIKAELKTDGFTFWLPEELGGGTDAAAPKHQEMQFITRHETRTVTGDGAKDAAPAVSHQPIVITLADVRKRQFEGIDANGDGKVSLQEYEANQTAQLTRGFEILDSSGDKSLSEDEYAKIVAPPMVRLNIQGAPGVPEIPKIDIPGMKSFTPEQIKAAFTRLDANKDGKLSLQEYLPKA